MTPIGTLLARRDTGEIDEHEAEQLRELLAALIARMVAR